MESNNPIEELARDPAAKEYIAHFECQTERALDSIEEYLGFEITDPRVTEGLLHSRVDHVLISDLCELLPFLGISPDADFELARTEVIQFIHEIHMLFRLFALPREEIFALSNEEKAERFFEGVAVTGIPYEKALRSLRHLGICDAFGPFPAHPLWARLKV